MKIVFMWIGWSILQQRVEGRLADHPITKKPKGPFWAFLESTPPYIGLIESSKCTEYENNVRQVYN